MRERSLVAFTVTAQAAVGMVWALVVVRWVAGPSADPWLGGPLLAVVALMAVAGAAAVLHLGSPRNAWRALAGIRSSWLSREVLAAAVFTLGCAKGAVTFGMGWGGTGFGLLVLAGTALLGAALVYAMARVYRLRTVPDWNGAWPLVWFTLTAVVLGALGLALGLSVGAAAGRDAAVKWLAGVAMAGMALELALLGAWRGHRGRARAEVDAGLWRHLPGRWAGLGRAALLVAGFLAGAGAMFMATVGAGSIGMALVPPTLMAALTAAAAAELVGRAAFYRGYARLGM